ncbi:hypothetical protein E4U58_001734 [Claviceps cyperi]|nr:hypothetical protein E4U58_001734 [Claviceps cyperi]
MCVFCVWRLSRDMILSTYTSTADVEDDTAPADPITIDDDTESDCDLQQKEVNPEDIEKMKVEEDDSDSKDEGSLGESALPQEQPLRKMHLTSVET